ncbi:hypothetical protein L1278_001503 [Pontibacter sp. HSC-36F09]|nr:hypothetical protein [Pontibacter sp. HSC-36F09]
MSVKSRTVRCAGSQKGQAIPYFSCKYFTICFTMVSAVLA